MSDDADGVLRIWFVYEVGALVGAFVLLAASLAGYTTASRADSGWPGSPSSPSSC
jgi:hypothetical protein